MLKIVHKRQREHFPEICWRVSDLVMNLDFGLKLQEVKPNGHCHTSVCSIDDSSYGSDQWLAISRKKGILVPLLGLYDLLEWQPAPSGEDLCYIYTWIYYVFQEYLRIQIIVNKKKICKSKTLPCPLLNGELKMREKMRLAITLYRRELGMEHCRETCFKCFYESRAVKHNLKIY